MFIKYWILFFLNTLHLTYSSSTKTNLTKNDHVDVERLLHLSNDQNVRLKWYLAEESLSLQTRNFTGRFYVSNITIVSKDFANKSVDASNFSELSRLNLTKNRYEFVIEMKYETNQNE